VAYITNQTFLADMGFTQRLVDGVSAGVLEIVPELCPPGTDQARTAVLATIADMAAGSVASTATLPRVCMTLDLSLRQLRPAVGSVRLDARILKSGRTTTVVETVFRDGNHSSSSSGGGGDVVALSWATFVASPRPEDVLELPPLSFTAPRQSQLTSRLEDQVGCRLVGPGVAEIDRVPYVMNPAGTVQGGIVALLAELAAESVAAESLAPDHVVTELDVRYLSATRVGPARATAAIVAGDVMRVEVRDPGNQDRLTAVALARVGPSDRQARPATDR
jgi:acyl-coenzyme A thioesterase PaaI-like protein